MKRVKKIKKVFQRYPPFAVIHLDGKEGKAGRRFPDQADTACQGTKTGVIAKQIKHGNQKHPFVIVVGVQDKSRKTSQCECQDR